MMLHSRCVMRSVVAVFGLALASGALAQVATPTTATPVQRPIVPQPVNPAAPAKSGPPVVPQSISPIDIEQVKPKEDVTLKQPAPNTPRPKITTRDGLAAEQ